MLIVTLIFTILLSICLSNYWDLSFAIVVPVCLEAIAIIISRHKHNNKHALIFSIFPGIISALLTSKSILAVSKSLTPNTSTFVDSLSFIVFTFFSVFYYCLFFKSYHIKATSRKKDNLLSIISISTIICFVLVYLPSEIMLNNYNDYLISFQEYLKSLIYPAIILIIIVSYITFILPPRLSSVVSSVFTALSIAAYYQYMFSNKLLPSLNGSVFHWQQYPFSSVINLIMWLIVIILVVFLRIKDNKKTTQIYTYICSLIHMILLISFIMNSSMADKNAFKMNEYTIDNSAQYELAEHKNIIVFIIDAFDNSYAKTLYNSSPELFDEFNDFTFYTNTCSVYDLTINSLPQMMTGTDFYNNQIDYNGFYNRIKDNNYTINFFNYECKKDSIDIRQYLDNYSLIDKSDSQYNIDRLSIISNTTKLSLYTLLPYITKTIVNPNEIDFTSQVSYADTDGQAVYYLGNRSNYKNNEFMNNLSLSINKRFNNAFILQHIEGTHGPLDDYETEAAYCLDIAGEYINQMKELGVYDEATIIFTSDHGLHDMIQPYTFPTAGTPIFFIKEPGVTHDEIVLNNAPIYHTDFLKTILINTGLYNESEDLDRFGSSIYDFDENSNRERCWYDSVENNNEYDYYEYKYIGDTSNLEYAVENDVYTAIKL